MNATDATVAGWHKEETGSVCVWVCGSHPSRAGGSWSAMRFGLPVAGWLTFEPPALHHALKTLPDASHERRKLISAFLSADIASPPLEKRDSRFGRDVYVLARAEMSGVQRSAWKTTAQTGVKLVLPAVASS